MKRDIVWKLEVKVPYYKRKCTFFNRMLNAPPPKFIFLLSSYWWWCTFTTGK